MTDKVAEMVNDIKEGEIWFTSLDMHYAYGQTVLHPETAKHCNFQIVGGESTGTYAFNTGCFGLDIMPPEFRKIINNILHERKNTFTIIDDILVVSKGTKKEHMEKSRRNNQSTRGSESTIKTIKMPNCPEKQAMVGIQTMPRRNKANRWKNTSNNKLRPKNLKGFKIVHGSNQSDEPIHTNFGKFMCSPEAVTGKKRQIEIGKRTRENVCENTTR